MESLTYLDNQKEDMDIKSECNQHIQDYTSEKSTEEFEIEIPLDNSKCFLLKPQHQKNSPGTVYFKSDCDFLKKIESKISKQIDKEKILDWKLKKFKNYCVLYKAYKNLPECINLPMKTNGVIRTKSFLKANLIWKLLKIDKMSNLIKNMNQYQRYNHFPCTWELGRKDNLWKNFKIMKKLHPEDYNFCPSTYLCPEEKEKFLKKLDADPNSMYIIKPVSSSRGRGIRLMTNRESIPRKCLISSYVSDPHLINNKKYDLRIYVLITGFYPLKIYIYEEGLVRFASENYSTDNNDMHNRFMHLTNYSINKCSSRFDKGTINVDNECAGSKWSLTALKHYFANNNLNFNGMWEKIKDIVAKTVISIAEETIEITKTMTKYSNTLFELYGFDVLIDENLRPWLIEVNLNPSLNCDTELDLKVKSSLMTCIFNTVGLIPYSHVHRKGEIPSVLKNEENQLKNNKNEKYMNWKNENIDEDLLIQNGEASQGSKENEMEIDSIDNENISHFKLKPNYKQKSEIVEYSLDEFSRCGLFERIFPKNDNIEYYSKFLHNPGEENLILWNWMKNNKNEI